MGVCVYIYFCVMQNQGVIFSCSMYHIFKIVFEGSNYNCIHETQIKQYPSQATTTKMSIFLYGSNADTSAEQ